MQTIVIKRKSTSKKTGVQKEAPQSVRVLNAATTDETKLAAIEDCVETIGVGKTYTALNMALHRGAGEKRVKVQGLAKGFIKSAQGKLSASQVDELNARIAEIEELKASMLAASAPQA